MIIMLSFPLHHDDDDELLKLTSPQAFSIQKLISNRYFHKNRDQKTYLKRFYLTNHLFSAVFWSNAHLIVKFSLDIRGTSYDNCCVSKLFSISLFLSSSAHIQKTTIMSDRDFVVVEKMRIFLKLFREALNVLTFLMKLKSTKSFVR